MEKPAPKYQGSHIMEFTQAVFMHKLNYKKLYWVSISETLNLITKNHKQWSFFQTTAASEVNTFTHIYMYIHIYICKHRDMYCYYMSLSKLLFHVFICTLLPTFQNNLKIYHRTRDWVQSRSNPTSATDFLFELEKWNPEQ